MVQLLSRHENTVKCLHNFICQDSLKKKKKGIYGAAANPQLGIILENAYFRFERFGFRGCYGAKTKLRGCDVIKFTCDVSNFTCDVINCTAGPFSSRLCGRIDLVERTCDLFCDCTRFYSELWAITCTFSFVQVLYSAFFYACLRLFPGKSFGEHTKF
jgi:hypothetical protein